VNLDHLLLLNLGIHLAATLLLALLVAEAVAALGLDRQMHAGIVMLAAASYLFTFEALYSHGIVYWHHSLFQVVWLLQLVMAARVFRCVESGTPIRRSDAFVLVATGALAPATEWTGYIATASIAGLCLWRAGRASRHPLRTIAIGMLLGAAVSGLAFIAHFASVVGFSPLFGALRSRAQFRSTTHGSFAALGAGYVESFGALLLFVGVVVATYAVVVRRRPGPWVIALLLAAVLPLSENLLLAQHATTYHFDRLKALVPLVVVSALAIAMMPTRFQQRALFAWLAVLAWNVTHLPNSRSRVVPLFATNDSLLQRVRGVARPCTLYATNAISRGWVELTLGGNTYETVPSLDSVRRLVAMRGACQGLYVVQARTVGQSMYVWRRAIAYDPATAGVDTLDWSAPK
jgi:hypothetical protein